MDEERDKIRIGISACLLGEPVRYDSGHKLDRYITATLGQWFEFVPVCPEAESGLGVPREAMRLEGEPAAPRLVTHRSRRDLTATLERWSARRLRGLAAEGLGGYILKSKSPSCGMERVKVYGDNGMPLASGPGLFARGLMARFPLLPVEEEGRLHDPRLRENFIERVFVFHRWRAIDRRPSARALVEFHNRHKLLLMAHSPKLATALGRVVANPERLAPRALCDRYAPLLDEALRLQATVRKNVNVLQHVMGYFKRQLEADEKRELQEVIDAYHQELVPLIVPVTLLNHYVRKHRQEYLAGQWYLNPHPRELKLRNHV